MQRKVQSDLSSERLTSKKVCGRVTTTPQAQHSETISCRIPEELNQARETSHGRVGNDCSSIFSPIATNAMR